MSYRKGILSALIATWLLSGPLTRSANSVQDDFHNGLNLFERRNYKAASECFERSLHLCPNDPNVLYYLAVACQKSGKVKRAQQLFNHVMKSFPNTTAAELSKLFLEGQFKQQNASSASSDSGKSPGPGQNLQLPASQTVQFERRGDRLVIKAQINDRPVDICFDTGAPSTFMSLVEYRSLNMPVPSGPPTGMVAGPNGDLFPSWEAFVKVKIGNLTRSHYPIVVVDNPNAA